MIQLWDLCCIQEFRKTDLNIKIKTECLFSFILASERKKAQEAKTSMYPQTKSPMQVEQNPMSEQYYLGSI